ncbi:MAG: hypothetical protein LBE20_01510 [Deltaproteobacteria bacterium]|jgi:hypothetical protein|nr:hypothetical protein [Deltaproteobacteria bacterium]
MKNLLLFAILTVFISFPSHSSAYVYSYNKNYNTNNSAIYSKKTTAYNNIYNPLRKHSNIPSLRSVNPYEARRIDYVLKQEKYFRDLALAEARADANYAKRRLIRQEKERRVEEQAKRRLVRNQQLAAKNNKNKVKTDQLLLADKKLLLDKKDKKNLEVVKSSDFNMISDSLEQNADYKYIPKKQEKVVLATTEQPSFFQRLRWALFGRN